MQNAAGVLLIASLTTSPRVEFPRVADGALFEKDASKAQVHDMAALAWTIGRCERALHQMSRLDGRRGRDLRVSHASECHWGMLTAPATFADRRIRFDATQQQWFPTMAGQLGSGWAVAWQGRGGR